MTRALYMGKTNLYLTFAGSHMLQLTLGCYSGHFRLCWNIFKLSWSSSASGRRSKPFLRFPAKEERILFNPKLLLLLWKSTLFSANFCLQNRALLLNFTQSLWENPLKVIRISVIMPWAEENPGDRADGLNFAQFYRQVLARSMVSISTFKSLLLCI